MGGLKVCFSLILLAFFSLFSKAQTPSFFYIGEDELSGVYIYDITQDNDNNYILATNNGIIKFDGNSYINISSSKMLSSSVFDLQKDNKGNIFCKNFSGQIFKINSTSLSLFYLLPDSISTTEYYYGFNNNNDLIISSNSIYLFKDSTLTRIGSKKKASYSELLKLKNGELLTYGSTLNEFYTINEEVSKSPIKIEHPSTAIIGKYFNDSLFFYDKNNGQLLFGHSNTYTIKNSFNLKNTSTTLTKYYPFKNTIWSAFHTGGIKIYDENFEALFNNRVILENTFISSCWLDNEGNYVLGTFGEGLIIIPNINYVTINFPDNDKISKITSGNNQVFLGSKKGIIYRLDKNYSPEILHINKTKNIEVLEYINYTNELLYDDKVITFINFKNKNTRKLNIGAVKDIYKLNDTTYYFASNTGLSKVITQKNKISADNKLGYNNRTICVGYNPISKKTYLGTSSGLKIGGHDNLKDYLFEDKKIVARDILHYNNKVLVATKSNGVLIFRNDSLIGKWDVTTGLNSNSIKKIKKYKNELYLLTDKSLMIINSDGNIVNELNNSIGFNTQNIIDFELFNDKLWIVHRKGLTFLDINKIPSSKFNPIVKLKNIWCNDSILPLNQLNSFPYFKNKFQFEFSSVSIIYQTGINYLYKLSGIDNDWQTTSYKKNIVEYKALQPGNYTFSAKATYKNYESKTLTYRFTIKPPWWKTWIFISICSIFLLGIIVTLYIFQLNRQKKKIRLQNELNASKLIAIQSQMNPHFIFNAINSIQDLILQGDVDNSYSYIIKFSKLVRQTLHFSNKNFIDIEDEIELLKIYLELEKLRFKDDFVFEIETNNIEDLQVPPMLIQPFVENAIKHGLLHKEGQKKLTISFSKTDILTCRVIDNGVGRKKAMEIKNRQQKKHESFSVNATQARFEIMKEQYGDNLGIEYIDLEENGESIGTTVTIKIPFQQNY